MASRINYFLAIVGLCIILNACKNLEGGNCNVLRIANPANKNLIFYLSSSDNSCVYNIGSGFYDGFSGQLQIDSSGSVFLKLDSIKGEFELLYTTNDTIGSHRNLSISLSNYHDSNSYSGKIAVEIHDRFQNEERSVIIWKFHDMLSITDYKDKFDGYAFYDLNRGFIGSYMKLPDDTKTIVGNYGDILQNHLDYSDISFGVLR